MSWVSTERHHRGKIVSNFIIITADLMSGLRTNDLDHFTHLLTGYVGSESFLQQVYETVRQLKVRNPGLVYGSNLLKNSAKNLSPINNLFHSL